VVDFGKTQASKGSAWWVLPWHPVMLLALGFFGMKQDAGRRLGYILESPGAVSKSLPGDTREIRRITRLSCAT
jgi:hypothetical protein